MLIFEQSAKSTDPALLGEYVIRENKNRIRPSTNSLSSDFNREVNARQVMTFRASRQAMYETTGAMDYGDRSSTQDPLAHVRLFSKAMVESDLFNLITKGCRWSEEEAQPPLLVHGTQICCRFYNRSLTATLTFIMIIVVFTVPLGLLTRCFCTPRVKPMIGSMIICKQSSSMSTR
jgi:hypothetical protein